MSSKDPSSQCFLRLAQTTARLLTANSHAAVLEVSHRMCAALGASRTTMALRSGPPDAAELWSLTTHGEAVSGHRHVQLLEHALHANNPVHIADLERFGSTGTGSWLGLPLRLGWRRLGVLVLEAGSVNAFDERLMGCLTLLAEHVSVKLELLERQEALERDRMAQLRQLEHAALEDALTGLRNRRAFEEELSRLATLAQRHGHTFAVGMIDLDGLKQVNDREGHERGDALLRTFAQLLNQQLRRGDSLYRLGGDEFALILPEFDLQASGRIQQLINRVVEDMLHDGWPVGASFGLAHCAEAATEAQVLELADERMYEQKARHHARRSGKSTAA